MKFQAWFVYYSLIFGFLNTQWSYKWNVSSFHFNPAIWNTTCYKTWYHLTNLQCQYITIICLTITKVHVCCFLILTTCQHTNSSWNNKKEHISNQNYAQSVIGKCFEEVRCMVTFYTTRNYLARAFNLEQKISERKRSTHLHISKS